MLGQRAGGGTSIRRWESGLGLDQHLQGELQLCTSLGRIGVYALVDLWFRGFIGAIQRVVGKSIQAVDEFDQVLRAIGWIIVVAGRNGDQLFVAEAPRGGARSPQRHAGSGRTRVLDLLPRNRPCEGERAELLYRRDLLRCGELVDRNDPAFRMKFSNVFKLMVEQRGFDAKAPAAPQMFGNAGLEHMERYGTTAEQFAKIGWKNHKHSVNNPYSQFRDEYTLQEILDAQTDPWGIKVVLVELKHIDLPQEMQRSMAKQAEAERERRAKIIHAEGEFQASQKLADAAEVIGKQPMALQLRFLQSLVEVASEKNSTTIFPVPID